MRIFLAAIFTLTALSAYGQTQTSPPGTSPCTLKVPQAPAVRGVKLGMKADDLVLLFAGSAAQGVIRSSTDRADGYPNFGVVRISLDLSEPAVKDRFAGVGSFSFVLLDGRLTQYDVEYQSPPGGPAWRRVDDWVAKLADSFKLPPATDWAVEQYIPDRKSLKCDGFQLQASNMNLRGNLTVSTVDTPYKKQEERRATYNEKLQREFKP